MASRSGTLRARGCSGGNLGQQQAFRPARCRVGVKGLVRGCRSGVFASVRHLLAGTGGPSTQLAGQSAQTTLLNLFAMFFGFVMSVVLSRLLGARGYGAYVYALAWPTVLAVAAQLGYGHLLVRSIASYSALEEWGLVRGIIRHSQRVVLAASVVLACAAGAVGWLFVGNGQPAVRQSFYIALPLVPALALIPQREAVLRGFRRVVLGRLPETLVQPILLLGFVAGLWLVLDGKVSPPEVVAATVAAAAGALVVGTVLIARFTPTQVTSTVPTTDRVTWSRSARSMFAVNALQIVNLQVGIVVLGAMATIDETAVFSVAVRLSGLVSFLQTAVIFPLAPAVARLHTSGQPGQLQRLVSRATLGVMILSAPVVVGLLLFGEQALGLFGDQFRTGNAILGILVVGELVNISSGFVGILLINTGHERTLFKFVVWLTVSNIGARIILIRFFGLEGAAIGQALGLGIQNLVLAGLVWRTLGIYSPGIGGRLFLRGSRP